MKIKKIEKLGTIAVRSMRAERLKDGLPSMINTARLPSNQCYLEYQRVNCSCLFIAKRMRF